MKPGIVLIVIVVLVEMLFSYTEINLDNSTDLSPVADGVWAEWGAAYSFEDAAGIGYTSWSAAADFDFGNQGAFLNSFEVGFALEEAGVKWKIVRFEEGHPTDDVFGSLQGVIDVNGGAATSITINDPTMINGHVALVLESGGNYLARDVEAVSDHSWIKTGDSWRLLSDISSVYSGAWYLRMNVTAAAGDFQPPEVVSISGTEVAVGKDMDISLNLFDSGAISEVIGRYRITGGGEQTFELVPLENKIAADCVVTSRNRSEKGMFRFSGTIPAQSSTVQGEVYFVLSDTCEPINTGETERYEISWIETDESPSIIHHDDSNNDLLGIQGKGDFTVASRFTPAELSLHYGKSLTGIRIYIGSIPDSLFLKVWQGGDGWNTTGALLFRQKEFADIKENSWNDFKLDLPFLLQDESEYWVGYEVISGGLTAGCDAGPVVNGKGGWWTIDGVWHEMEEYGYNINWNIRLGVNDGLAVEDTYLKSFSLLQNYPNPFNPVTTIEFELRTEDEINLIVYNIRGEIVWETGERRLQAGDHMMQFDGSGLNSGVYYYSLKVGGEMRQTRKMVLVK